MQESIVFLVRVQCHRKESSRSLSHLLMSFLYNLLRCITCSQHAMFHTLLQCCTDYCFNAYVLDDTAQVYCCFNCSHVWHRKCVCKLNFSFCTHDSWVFLLIVHVFVTLVLGWVLMCVLWLIQGRCCLHLVWLLTFTLTAFWDHYVTSRMPLTCHIEYHEVYLSVCVLPKLWQAITLGLKGARACNECQL